MAELSRVHSTESPKALNVVFIHGLGGDARMTWMHDPQDIATLWPQWVGQDAQCNVWVLGYDAAFSGWRKGAMPLPEQGTALMSALLYEPDLLDRPLVLVGHSLGGLVIKSGIVNAENLGDPRFQRVMQALAAVVFVGTPHQGSGLATLTVRFAFLLRTNPQVLNMMLNDAWLKNLNGQFRAIQAKRKFGVNVFSETTGVFVGRKIFGISVGPRVLIVNRNSSDPNIPEVAPIPVEGDHIQIAKPSTRESPIHKAILGFIAEIQGAPAPRLQFDMLEINRAFHKASSPLLTWPSALPGGVWLERPELHIILQTLSNKESSATLLLGEPGSGKSALLNRIAKVKHTDGWPVLAIKADRLPPDIVNAEALAEHLRVPTSVTETVRGLANSGPIVIIIVGLTQTFK
jgi:pimeloyl-ACP methyl ester carboxylesterase